MTDGRQPGCRSCELTTEWRTDPAPPPRDEVVVGRHWRVAHAFNSTLPGWLVLVPPRHVEAFTDLTEAALGEMGDLVHRLSAALEQVTGCTKTYLMQFSEAEGYRHLHLHLVPRMPDQPAERRGPAVFGYLAEDPATWLPAAEQDRVALAVRDALPA